MTDTVNGFRDSLKKMEVISAMMCNLLQDLLDLGQIESKSFQLNNEYFDLLKTIQKAFLVVNGAAEFKQVSLVAPEIQAENRNVLRHIFGDERRYTQIIVNFLSNAIKFSSQNS